MEEQKVAQLEEVKRVDIMAFEQNMENHFDKQRESIGSQFTLLKDINDQIGQLLEDNENREENLQKIKDDYKNLNESLEKADQKYKNAMIDVA